MGPTLAEIQTAADSLKGRIVDTPAVGLTSDRITRYLPAGVAATLKLELFQQTGSFKARGELLAIDALSDAEREVGVTGVSAGNHAVALSWAAAAGNVSVKVVMPEYADPVRIAACRQMGAEVVLTKDIAEAFATVQTIHESEGRKVLHPFDSEHMVLGAATIGLEMAAARPDAIIIPIGGGGLIAGIASAVKLVSPETLVFGVEPTGAAAMSASFTAGKPVTIPKVDTIADSLGAPMALPYSYGIIRENVDQIVTVSDDEMKRAMVILFDALKLACEPACASSTAALIGPLAETLKGKRVGLIACGSNIGEVKFAGYLREGREMLEHT